MNWNTYRSNIKKPKKLVNCPISEAVAELRFFDAIPTEVILGNVYKVLVDQGFVFENLPITNVPRDIRVNDANLKFLPEYRFKRENKIISFGSRVISFSCLRPYSGWNDFFGFIVTHLKFVKEFQSKFNRLGLRYINMYPGVEDINKVTIITNNFGDYESEPVHSNLHFVVRNDELITNIRITNKAKFNNQPPEGVLIDLDTFKEGEILFKQIPDLLTRAHEEEGQTFFALLQPSLILEEEQ